MRKISLSLIATLIALPALASSNTSAPMGTPMATPATAVKPVACEMPVKPMKKDKHMKTAAAKAPVHHEHKTKEHKVAMVAPAPMHHMGSMFDGWRLTGGATYAWNSSTSTAAMPVNNADYTATLPSAFSKFYLDFGYTKVIEKQFLLGASILGGYDNYAGNSGSKFTPDLPAEVTKVTFGPDWFMGGKLNVGVLLGEKVALKLIGEVNYSRYNLSATENDTPKNTLGWNFGSAIGAGVDFAVTDRVIVGLGAKWKMAPTTVTLNQISVNNASAVTLTPNQNVTYSGNNFEIFAEIGYRLSQN